MLVEVRHFFPGRVRLFAPGLFAPRAPGFGELPDRIVLQLLPADAVRKVRANPHCASIVIEYDRNRPGVVADIVNRLRQARSLAVLTAVGEALALQASANGTTAVTPAPRQDLRPRFPLALPTVSLILSFVAGPAALVVNVPLMLWNSRIIGRRAWRVLSQEKRLNVDFLDALAISVSMLNDAFPTAGIIIWLVRLGDWIRDLTAARSKRARGSSIPATRST